MTCDMHHFHALLLKELYRTCSSSLPISAPEIAQLIKNNFYFIEDGRPTPKLKLKFMYVFYMSLSS